MATQKDRVVVEIVVNSKGANAALKKINGNLTKIQKSAKSTSDHLRFFRDVTGLATFAVALNRITASFIKVNIQAQKLEKGFTAVLGSSELAADQMNRAREIADRLGLDYLSSSQSLVQLTAASKGTSLAGEETLRIFEAVSGAMSLLGKSADDTQGALKSIEQMINKGSIAAEELKGQLGERLSGALAIMAQALNKSTKEIFNMMEAGELMTEEKLPKFIDRLEELYNTDERINGVVQSWNRYNNAINQLFISLGKSGIIDSLTESLERFATSLQVLGELGEEGFFSGVGIAQWEVSMQKVSGYIPGMVRAQTELAEAYKELEDYQNSYLAQILKATGGEEAYKDAVDKRTRAIERLHGVVDSLIDSEKERLRVMEQTRAQEEEIAAEMKARQAYEAAIESERKALEKLEKVQLRMFQSLAGIKNRYVERVNLSKALLGGKPEDAESIRAEQSINAEIVKLQVRYPTAELDQETIDEAKEAANEAIRLDKELAKVQKSAELLKSTFQEMSSSFVDAFVDMATGAATAEEALKSLFGTVAKAMIKVGLNSLSNSAGGGFWGQVAGNIKFADGGVTSTGLPHGVYNRPTAFPINGGGRFASGVGIMGEAGPEAIMPLTRRNGKLGVEGGGVNINVNNYAGVDVQTRQGINPGDIDIIVKRVADDVARGGSPVGRSIESTYGLARGKGRR